MTLDNVIAALELLPDETLDLLKRAAQGDPAVIRSAVQQIEHLRGHATTANILRSYGLWVKHVDPDRQFAREAFYWMQDGTKLRIMREQGLATDDHPSEG